MSILQQRDLSRFPTASDVFLAAINASLIQILFTVEAPDLLVMSFYICKSKKC